MDLQEIKNKYNNLDINTSGGADSYRPEVSDIVERDNVACIIKHPTENTYLVAKWKKVNWNGFLTGGIESGMSREDTVRQEVPEETGYKNIKRIVDMNFVYHGLFYHVVKNQNRLAHYNLMYVALENLEQGIISEEEKDICDFVWVSESEVLDSLTREDMKAFFRYYISNKDNL